MIIRDKRERRRSCARLLTGPPACGKARADPAPPPFAEGRPKFLLLEISHPW
jgi:hypothetical protein